MRETHFKFTTWQLCITRVLLKICGQQQKLCTQANNLNVYRVLQYTDKSSVVWSGQSFTCKMKCISHECTRHCSWLQLLRQFSTMYSRTAAKPRSGPSYAQVLWWWVSSTKCVDESAMYRIYMVFIVFFTEKETLFFIFNALTFSIVINFQASGFSEIRNMPHLISEHSSLNQRQPKDATCSFIWETITRDTQPM